MVFGEGTELTVLESHFSQELDSSLWIGNHVCCIGGCRITCAGRITIEVHVGQMWPDVFIPDYNHGMNPLVSDGYSKQPLPVKNVKIEEGVWLGQRVCILSRDVVGAHSIIGANSVVTHNIPAYCIAIGSPAKVTKRWDKLTDSWEKVQ